MDIIESGNPDAFQEYLSEFENTICGRHPIGVFLHVSILISAQLHRFDGFAELFSAILSCVCIMVICFLYYPKQRFNIHVYC